MPPFGYSSAGLNAVHLGVQVFCRLGRTSRLAKRVGWLALFGQQHGPLSETRVNLGSTM